ncbi:MAG: PilZ domain-containing protein [Myxococcales bacterium]|nr:PilZ domain-containing protein [Myxococcales bacterium]
MRVPVRGTAVLHAHAGPLHGTLENLSRSGALLQLETEPVDPDHELELALVDGRGTIGARTVRVEPAPRDQGWWLAVAFDRVDPEMRGSIEAAIETSLAAARERPILVIDSHEARRTRLIDRLVDRGMTPLAPRTPLETIELLNAAHLTISVCLLTRGADLEDVLADAFPWVTTSEITDDVEATVARAIDTWCATPNARFGIAIG